jgi:hypothetical protein
LSNRRKEVRERITAIPGSSYGRYGIFERWRPE